MYPPGVPVQRDDGLYGLFVFRKQARCSVSAKRIFGKTSRKRGSSFGNSLSNMSLQSAHPSCCGQTSGLNQRKPTESLVCPLEVCSACHQQWIIHSWLRLSFDNGSKQ